RLIINTWGQNGQDSPMFIIRRPMLEECTQYTTAPSAWVNSGVTAIHGGSIVTNTITAQQIAGGTITAQQIAGGTITADKLLVTKLSALSSELG
ncbi:hypothetical protein ACN9OU_12175, partial [Glaesserella parasuis]